MSAVLFPYATLSDGEPTLRVTGVRLDGAARLHLVKQEDSTVLLYEDPKRWTKAVLDLELTCNAKELIDFEGKHGLVEAVAVTNCPATNERQPVRLRRLPEVGRWSGTLELDRDNVCDRIDLLARLTATIKGVAHRPVATALEWSIYADEPESLRLKGTLRVRWLNFKLPGAPLPACDFPESTHIVAFPGGMPEIWLNSGFEGLESLLGDRKDRRGADKGLHDFQRTGIARAAWMTLIADAMSAVQGGANDAESGEPDWPEKPWQTEILKLLLPQVAPGKSER
jgi:hypothetical protein